jgi:hypothetical protein
VLVEPPTASDILALVATFLQEEIVARIDDDKVRFRVQVAANLLQVSRREIDSAATLPIDRDGYAVTDALLDECESLRAMTDSLLSGKREITEPRTYALLRQLVDAKLRIAAPQLLSAQDKLPSAKDKSLTAKE